MVPSPALRVKHIPVPSPSGPAGPGVCPSLVSDLGLVSAGRPALHVRLPFCLFRSCMQLGRTAWGQMSPSSMQSCALGAGPISWQVRLS